MKKNLVEKGQPIFRLEAIKPKVQKEA